MKVADYSRIAQNYDNNPLRLNIDKDNFIEDAVNRSINADINIVDIACGTGNYIHVQQNYYPSEKISWFGVDNSQEMLEIAKGKLNGVQLIRSKAENLPYDNDFFHYISCNNAFHHFVEKEKAICEMYRILKPQGILKIGSIAPHLISNSWVYHYFPETRIEDMKRFWTHDQLFHELELMGMITQADVSFHLSRVPLMELYIEAKNRDASQLHLISENAYNLGIKHMEIDLEHDENKMFKRGFAYMNISAIKQ